MENKNNYIFSYFKAHRKAQLGVVNTVTQETEFLNQLNQATNSENFVHKFKQYLVNKKVYEAFDYMNSRTESLSQNKIFYDNFTDTLKSIFHDDKLKLEFVQEKFEFFLHFGDGRKITFNQLSEGFSAFVSILMDLFMRTDLIRKQNSNFNLNPKGIVLIDEPETHLHLEMQYEILPMLDTFFPNLQLIIATHSPAIISSLKESLVYDLTTKKEVSGSVIGSSFSELMTSHFGLKNEFSPVVDKLLLDFNEALQNKNIQKLNELIIDNESILTPSLRLEMETRIIEIKETAND
jgi:predicted ATP-binding protein involved in virulence